MSMRFCSCADPSRPFWCRCSEEDNDPLRVRVAPDPCTSKVRGRPTSSSSACCRSAETACVAECTNGRFAVRAEGGGVGVARRPGGVARPADRSTAEAAPAKAPMGRADPGRGGRAAARSAAAAAWAVCFSLCDPSSPTALARWAASVLAGARCAGVLAPPAPPTRGASSRTHSAGLGFPIGGGFESDDADVDCVDDRATPFSAGSDAGFMTGLLDAGFGEGSVLGKVGR